MIELEATPLSRSSSFERVWGSETRVLLPSELNYSNTGSFFKEKYLEKTEPANYLKSARPEAERSVFCQKIKDFAQRETKEGKSRGRPRLDKPQKSLLSLGESKLFGEPQEPSLFERALSKKIRKMDYHWRGTSINCPVIFERVELVDGEMEYFQYFSGKVQQPNLCFDSRI